MHMRVDMPLHVSVCMPVRMSMCVNTRMPIRMSCPCLVHVCVHVYTHVCACLCTCLRMSIHMYVRMSIYTGVDWLPPELGQPVAIGTSSYVLPHVYGRVWTWIWAYVGRWAGVWHVYGTCRDPRLQSPNREAFPKPGSDTCPNACAHLCIHLYTCLRTCPYTQVLQPHVEPRLAARPALLRPCSTRTARPGFFFLQDYGGRPNLGAMWVFTPRLLGHARGSSGLPHHVEPATSHTPPSPVDGAVLS